MILKIKSIIYKYTGVFLAYKEENQYINSKEFWKEFARISKANKKRKDGLPVCEIHGLLVGMWEAHHGFARPASFLRYKITKNKRTLKYLRPFFKIADWFYVLYLVIKWDIKDLIRWIRNK